MGTYYTNHIQVIKKDGGMDNKDIANIKEVFLKFFKSQGEDEVFLKDVSSLFDQIDVNSLEGIKIKDPFFYIMEINNSGLYFTFNIKYINCLEYIADLKKAIGRKFNIHIVTYEDYYMNYPKHLNLIRDQISDQVNTIDQLTNILKDIVSNPEATDSIIKKAVSVNNKEVIKASCRNKNISDETLDSILDNRTA